MFRIITLFSIWCVAAMLVPMGAAAQPPVEFNNSAQALKQYEAGTLEGLRERCTAGRTDNYQAPAEVQALRNGYVDVVPQAPRTGLYSIFIFDQDKRSFMLVDGQLLNAGTPLLLKLALPRDYGRCRITRDGAGLERLEVVHLERNYVSDAQRFQRLMKESVDLADSAACNQTADAGQEPVPRLWRDGKPTALSACGPTASLRDRMGRLIRKVYER